MNRFTNKQFDQVKNTTYTLVTFDVNGLRAMTYGGLSLFKVQEKMLETSDTTIMFNDSDLSVSESCYSNIKFFINRKKEIISERGRI